MFKLLSPTKKDLGDFENVLDAMSAIQKAGKVSFQVGDHEIEQSYMILDTGTGNYMNQLHSSLDMRSIDRYASHQASLAAALASSAQTMEEAAEQSEAALRGN